MAPRVRAPAGGPPPGCHLACSISFDRVRPAGSGAGFHHTRAIATARFRAGIDRKAGARRNRHGSASARWRSRGVSRAGADAWWAIRCVSSQLRPVAHVGHASPATARLVAMNWPVVQVDGNRRARGGRAARARRRAVMQVPRWPRNCDRPRPASATAPTPESRRRNAITWVLSPRGHACRRSAPPARGPARRSWRTGD